MTSTNAVVSEQSTTASDMVKNITDNFVELQRSLSEGLFQQLEQQTASLREEAQAKSDEAATLRQRHVELQPRVAARQRIVSYKIDEATAEGRDAEIPALKAEAAQATRDLADLLQQATLCDARVKELEEQQRRYAQTIFEQEFPKLRTPLVEVQAALCSLLDGLWSDLERYEGAAGLEGSRNPYRRGLLIPTMRLDLTAREKGPEANLYQQLLYRFGYNR